MIREWIEKKLQDKLFRQKHEVMKLQWEKARLERRIEQEKLKVGKK